MNHDQSTAFADSMTFAKFAVLGLLYINLGRPQDALPILKGVYPGMVFGLMVLGALWLQPPAAASARRGGQFFIEKKWFVAFCGLMVVSSLFSIYLRLSVQFLQEYLKVIVLLAGLLKFMDSQEDFKRLAKVFVASVLTLCLPVVGKGIGLQRMSVGSFYDPNDLAMLVCCALPFVLYMVHNGRLAMRLVAVAAVAAGVAAVIATQSRMGFLALVANGLLYLFFSGDSGSRLSRKLAVTAGVVVLFSTLAGSFYWQRIHSTFDSGQTGSGRLVIWERSLKIIARYPVVGSGPGTFISAYGRMLQQGGFEETGNEYDRAWKAAHNSYLVVAAELGVGGLAVFLLLIHGSLRRLLWVRRFSRQPPSSMVLQRPVNAVLASYLIFLFCALFLSQAYSALFVTLLAASVLIHKLAIDAQPLNQPSPQRLAGGLS